MHLGEYRIDLDQNEVHVRGEVRRLTPAEGKLLRYLGGRAGETVSHEELLRQVWGYAPATKSRTVQVTVQRLRAKIEDDPREPRYLTNVYGVGYRLQLPTRAAPTGLVGRTAELQSIAASAGAVALLGPGGVGKSRLARAAAEQGGGAWVRVPLAGCTRAEELLVRLASAIGHRGTTRGSAALQQALIEAAPERLILDEAEGTPELAGALANALADAGRHVIVTSRITVPGVRSIDVRPLDPAPATELFLRRVEMAVGHRPDPASVHAVVEGLDRLPLALELAAARAGLVPLDQLVGRLDWLRQGDGRHESLEACLEASWTLLSDHEQEVLGVASAFVAGFDVVLLEAAVGTDALGVVERLRSASLLQADEGRLRLLDTVRWFVSRRAPSDAADRAAAAVLTLEGHDEVDNALALVEVASPALVLQLVERYRGSMLAVAPLAELGRWLARGREAALALGDGDAVLRLRRFDPHLRQWAGDTPGALAEAEAVLAEAEAAGARRWVVVALRDRSTFLRRLGRIDEALATADEAVARAGEDDAPLAALALSEHAEALQAAGRFDEALPVLDRVLAVRIATGDVHKEALAVGSKARTLRSLQRPRAAIAHYTRCLDLFRQLEDTVNEAIYLGNLGHALADVGRYDEAAAAFASGRALAESRGDAVAIAFHLHGAGRCARLAGQPEQAAARLVAAAYQFEALALPGPRANSHAELALALAAQGAHDEALAELAVAEALLIEHALPPDPVVEAARTSLG